jgi:hypothetical protein
MSSLASAQVTAFKAIRDTEGVLGAPLPDVLVADLTATSALLRCRFWTDSRRANVLAVGSEVRRRVKEALDEEKIYFTSAVTELPLKVALANAKTDSETDADARETAEPNGGEREETSVSVAPPKPAPEAVSQAKTEVALPKEPSPETQ